MYLLERTVMLRFTVFLLYRTTFFDEDFGNDANNMAGLTRHSIIEKFVVVVVGFDIDQ